MSLSDGYFLNQEAQLQAFESKRVNRYLRLLELARKSLKSEIAGYDGSQNVNRLQGLISQIDGIEKDLKSNLQDITDPIQPLREMVVEHQEAAITAITETSVTIGFDQISTGVLERVVDQNFQYITSISDKQFEDLRSVIFNQIGVQGQNALKVARDVTGPDGQFAKMFYYQVENVLRTETNTLYNEMRLDSLTSVNAALDLGLNKRIVERIDPRRNHPISLALNGQVQLTEKSFRVAADEVRGKLSELEPPRKISQSSLDRSIFWQRDGDFYAGMNLPAHYNERGVVVPTNQDVNISV